jgi:hypothetical protein
MTRSEYQELVEFLGPKFDKVEERFDAVEERLTRAEVLGEENRHQVQAVSEAFSFNRKATARELTAIRSEMTEGFATVWSGFGILRQETAEGFKTVRAESAAEFKTLRAEMAKGFAGAWSEFETVRAELVEGFQDLRTEMAKGI